MRNIETQKFKTTLFRNQLFLKATLKLPRQRETYINRIRIHQIENVLVGGVCTVVNDRLVASHFVLFGLTQANINQQGIQTTINKAFKEVHKNNEALSQKISTVLNCQQFSVNFSPPVCHGNNEWEWQILMRWC